MSVNTTLSIVTDPSILLDRIWEKKYGRNANHLIKKREIKGFDQFGKGPHSGTKGNRFGQNHLLEVGKPLRTARAHVITDKTSVQTRGHISTRGKAKEEGPLHPSWEAAKRQKLRPMIMPSTGKKIVF